MQWTHLSVLCTLQHRGKALINLPPILHNLSPALLPQPRERGIRTWRHVSHPGPVSGRRHKERWGRRDKPNTKRSVCCPTRVVFGYLRLAGVTHVLSGARGVSVDTFNVYDAGRDIHIVEGRETDATRKSPRPVIAFLWVHCSLLICSARTGHQLGVTVVLPHIP